MDVLPLHALAVCRFVTQRGVLSRWIPPPSLGDRPRTRPRFVQYKTDLSGFVFNSDHLSYVIHILGNQHSMYIMPISTKRFSFPNFGSYDTDTYITPRVSILASDVK